MIKIFADHCIHTDLVEALRKVGFKVIRALEVSFSKASDEEIFAYAQRKSLVLLTFDKEFGDFRLFKINKSPGIVIVDIERMSKDLIIKRTIDFFRRATSKDLFGKLFIIEPAGVRIH